MLKNQPRFVCSTDQEFPAFATHELLVFDVDHRRRVKVILPATEEMGHLVKQRAEAALEQEAAHEEEKAAELRREAERDESLEVSTKKPPEAYASIRRKDAEVPRDRHGSFEPQLIPKHQTRWAGFDDKIISLYARGMTVREIQSHLQEMYGAEVSPSLISSVTDAVSEEVKVWQARPLDAIYPIVYLDCIHVKVREGTVRVKAVYLAIGINMAGEKEVLGLWLAQTEGAKFWLQVVTELRNRGVQDIFIACVDGLKGFPEAIEAVFPKTVVQLCIVHMVRHSLNYVSWKRRKEVATDLRLIYQAATAEEAEMRLGEFEAKWDSDYLPIGQSWRRNWSRLTPFFDYPPEIRKVIYTTNAIESVNMGLRKLSKNRGSFPSDEALTKLFYLALRNISQKWTMPIRDWKAALTRFTIQFGDRISVN